MPSGRGVIVQEGWEGEAAGKEKGTKGTEKMRGGKQKKLTGKQGRQRSKIAG